MQSQRRSQQREKIYEAVRSSVLHPSAETVYAQLKQELPRLSLGTVYRNLQQMAEEGRLRRIDGLPVRFDGRTDAHSHFFCTHCGQVVDMPPADYEQHLDRAAASAGFRVERYALYFYGICPTCTGENIKDTPA